jgi:hypothetical protein
MQKKVYLIRLKLSEQRTASDSVLESNLNVFHVAIIGTESVRSVMALYTTTFLLYREKSNALAVQELVDSIMS